MTALKLIYNKLLSGEIFGKIDQHHQGGTYFWNVLYASDKYIHWTHYGSSANTISLKNLKWIIAEIFRTTPEQFLYDYTTYSEWKRIDTSYLLKDVR